MSEKWSEEKRTIKWKLLEILDLQEYDENQDKTIDKILSAVVEALPGEKEGYSANTSEGWNAYRKAAIAAIKGGE